MTLKQDLRLAWPNRHSPKKPLKLWALQISLIGRPAQPAAEQAPSGHAFSGLPSS